MEFPEEEMDELFKKYYNNEEFLKGFKEGKKTDKVTVWVNEDGPEVFGQKKWSKSEMIFPIPLKIMSDIYCNGVKDLIEGNKMVQKFTRLESNENTDVLFFCMRIPIPFVANRFSLIRRRWRLSEEKFEVGEKSIEQGSYKVEPGKKDVHMRTCMMKRYEAIDEKSTRVTTFGVNSMGGNMKKLEAVMEKMGGLSMMVKMLGKEIENWVKLYKKMQESEKKKDSEKKN